jgi:hypothetical protein
MHFCLSSHIKPDIEGVVKGEEAVVMIILFVHIVKEYFSVCLLPNKWLNLFVSLSS